MRYWGILLAKLVLAGAILYAIWFGLYSWYTPPEHLKRFGHSPFMHDLKWTTLMFVYNLLVQGVLFLIIWDQRYRCRTCGRRLRMPVSKGRYAQMLLFGRPQTEYICAYGHGTLQVPDLHIGGHEPNKWQPHSDDIWKELYSVHDAEKKN
jgi:hypothetical protein